MDKKYTKSDDNKVDRVSRDRGDLKKSLLTKALEDLGINKYFSVRDRGDSLKTNASRHIRTINSSERSNLKVIRPSVKKKVLNEFSLNLSPAADRKYAKKIANDSTEDITDSVRRDRSTNITPKAVENVKVTPKVVESVKVTSKAVENTKFPPRVIEKKKFEVAKAKIVPILTGKNDKDAADKTKDLNDTKHNVKSNVIESGNSNSLHDGSKQLDKPFTLDIFDGKKDEGAKRKNVSIPFRRDVRPDKVEAQSRPYSLDLEGRKRLREKYTLKLKNNIQDGGKGILKNDEREIKKQTDVEAKSTEPTQDVQIDATKTAKKSKPRSSESTLVQRKPIIKTIRISNDNRVYKAVTFTDQKESTPLQIKMPNVKKKTQEVLKFKNVKLVASKQSIQMKPAKKRKEKNRLKVRIQSPITVKSGSPSTEVAKWAPSCISRHTKPYYEAWVDTTLAAYNKCSEKDKLYIEKHNVIKTFKRALEIDETPGTPDLVYEKFNDERYTGRIRVRQSNTKESHAVKKYNNVIG